MRDALCNTSIPSLSLLLLELVTKLKVRTNNCTDKASKSQRMLSDQGEKVLSAVFKAEVKSDTLELQCTVRWWSPEHFREMECWTLQLSFLPWVHLVL